MLIDKKKLEGTKVLQPEEMTTIQGGSLGLASFTCTCVGADGKVVTKQASSFDECWDLC